MSEKSGLQNFLSSFSDLARLPRALWFVIGAFVIDTAAYYGVLTLMTVFLHSDLGWSDQRSGVTVSVFTMLVTLFMLGVGSYAERFGLRRAILFALLLTLGGRALYTLSSNLGSGVSVALIVLAALVSLPWDVQLSSLCVTPA